MTQPQPPLETLINQLNAGDPNNPDAEWQAAIALGDVTPAAARTRAVEALIAVMQAGRAHALTRSHAVESLGRLQAVEAIPILLNAAENDNYRLVRAYALSALGRLATDAAIVERLLQRLPAESFYGARAEAVAAAAAIALRADDNVLRQRVAGVLRQQRIAEAASAAPGAVRIIAEIDRALPRLQAPEA